MLTFVEPHATLPVGSRDICSAKRSVVNNIGASVMAMDAVCMALLAAAATVWEGTSRERHVSTAVIALQLFTLCGEHGLRM